MKRSRPLGERFWKKVDKRSAEKCWPWLGSRFNAVGYGRFTLNGKRVPAHRVAWSLAVGEIPEGLYVCHKCDNPICVNPGHLFLGSAVDNNADRDAKGRGRFPFKENPHLAIVAGRKGRQAQIRNSAVYAFNGESLTLLEWSKRTGFNYRTLRFRLNILKWPIHAALTVPPNYANRLRQGACK